MSRKILTKTFEPPNPWEEHSLEVFAAYLGHKHTGELQKAITQARLSNPVSSDDEIVQNLAKAPWQTDGRSFSIKGEEFYRAINIDPTKAIWLAYWKKPPEKTKEEELNELQLEWEDLVRKDYGRPNLARMRAVHERRKTLLNRPPVSGRFKGELFNFVSTMSSIDPRQSFPCAIMPNGFPVAIEIALDYCDQDFEIKHLTLVEFSEHLLAASKAEALARDQAATEQVYEEILDDIKPATATSKDLWT